MATIIVDDSCDTQVQIIDGKGVFKVTGLDNFIKTSDMANTGLDYAVVGIIGPQSSGKSTLMNLLFHTGFKEMDASKGRSQTTRGIWIDKCTGIKPCTIALDIEGTDGRERGEDDTAFEKQSALFALAVSDIVLINLWCHDVGREHAAIKPLLRTVFQVMLRLLNRPRKITLFFVLRDKTIKTPLKYFDASLREDIQKIWDEIPKPKAHIHTPLLNFFNVEVTALSNYETQEEDFKREVSELRKCFYHSTAPGGLAGDRRDVVPASAFSTSTQEIWKSIRENKDLNLPTHKVMVATMRCEAIAKEKLDHLRSNEGWLKLKEAAQSGLVQGFGAELNSIIATCLSHYDKETEFFDKAVRNAKREQLESEALNEAYHAYTTMLGHLRSKALADFKTKLDKSLNNGEEFVSSVHMCTKSIMLNFKEGSAEAAPEHANWDDSKVQSKLRSDIDSHVELLKITMEAEKSAKTLAIVKEEAEKNAKALAIVKEEAEKSAKTLAIVKKEAEKSAKTLAIVKEEAEKSVKTLAIVKKEAEKNDKALAILKEEAEKSAKTLAITKKNAEKSAKTLATIKEVAIGTAVGVAGVAGSAVVISLGAPVAGVGTTAVAISVMTLAAPTVAIVNSVCEFSNKYKSKKE